MLRLTLHEYQTSKPIGLTIEQRDALRSMIPDLRIDPVAEERDVYLLTAGSTIGTAAAKDLSVEIQPKVAIERVLFLVSHSLGLAKWDEQAQFLSSAHESLVEAMVHVFEVHLGRALRRGVLQGYRSEDAALMGVRGRIRFDEQIRKHFGVPLPLEVRFDEFTEDILENRLLRAAIAQLGRLRLRREQSRLTLRRFEKLLEQVELTSFEAMNVPPVVYTRLNEHYRSAVEWARIILKNASFETQHGEAAAAAVLFDMNSVFEEFVRTALREELRLSSKYFPNGRTAASLFLDANRQVSLEPDLSWWLHGRCRFVGDVKYKRVYASGVKHPDLYQLLAYTVAAELHHGLLIYAAGEGSPTDHEVSSISRHLHVRSVDLSGSINNLLAEIRQLAALIRDLVRLNAQNAA